MKTTNRREAILSKTEYDIMSIIWDINRSASAREIYDLLDPKPAYTTLATEMRTLYEKGFVDYFKKDGEGKTHYYIAKIGKGEYVRKREKDLLRRQPALHAQLLHPRRGTVRGGTHQLPARNGGRYNEE